MTRLYRLSLATVLATFALIVVGSVARLHRAGAGCGNDWPRCNGSWLPPLAWEPIVEYIHRGLALTVVGLTAGTVIVALRTPGVSRRARVLAGASLGAIAAQSALGGFVARWGAPPAIGIGHLTLAMLFLAFATATAAGAAALRGRPTSLADLGRDAGASTDRPFAIVASFGAALALLLVVFGASTSASGAFACATWPLCAESATGADSPTMVHLGYRATVLLGTLAAAAAALLAWRRGAAPTARYLSTVAIGLVALQSGLNAVAAVLGDPVWMSSPHLVVATLFWITMLAIALVAWGPRPEPALAKPLPGRVPSSASSHSVDFRAASGHSTGAAMVMTNPIPVGLWLTMSPLLRLRRLVVDYVALTKPGIMTLLLTTTLCAMLIATRGLPPFWLVAMTLLGGMLAAGGANVLNCFVDRDIDAQMARTRDRAIAAGRISPAAGLVFGITLTLAAALVLGFLVNWTAAALAMAGNLFYVFVYTTWLKRATPYNIVIGGAAGAAPPLVGWAAVTGDLSPLAWGLFAVIFAWTPPHFWALALLKQGDYTRAAVPMLPVVSGEAETRRQIVIYTVLLFLVCLALAPLGLGGIYLVSALMLNGIFLWYAIRLAFSPSKRVARQMFFYSLWYLALLFTAAVVDRIVIT
ncbi:MAG: heme o synthase [Chloroflexota bacterium]|nr:heme o synthase [Chloroflexota bacterium]